jgi:hypothetical protein
MDRFAKFGANDTEPRCVARSALCAAVGL